MQNSILLNYSIAPYSLTTKPDTKEYLEECLKENKKPLTTGEIVNNFQSIKSSAEQFRDFVCPEDEGGHPWSQDFGGRIGSKVKKDNKNFKGAQIMVLDFDNGIQPEQIIEICNSYEITPSFVHTSLRDSQELRKFRVMWFFEEAITSVGEFEELQDNLCLIFEGRFSMVPVTKMVKGVLETVLEDPAKPDPNGKGASRFFYPGKKVILFNQTFYNLEDFKSKVISSAILSSGKFLESNLQSNKKSENKSGGDFEGKKYNGGNLIQKFNFEGPAKILSKYVDFTEGTRISFLWRRFIFSGLTKVEGGQKFCQECIAKCDYNQEHNVIWLKYMAKKYVFPLKLSSLGIELPAELELYKDKTILDFGKIVEDFVWRKEESVQNTKDKKQARKEIKQYIKDFCISDKKRVILECPTGVGKTDCTKNLTAEEVKNTIHLKKDHRLCEEFKVDCVHNLFYVKPFPELKDKNFQSLISLLQGAKRIEEAKQLLSPTSQSFSLLCQEDQEKILDHNENRRQMLSLTGVPLLMTHEMFKLVGESLAKQGYDKAICDEDVSLFNTEKIDLEELKSVSKSLEEGITKSKSNKTLNLLKSFIKEDGMKESLDMLINYFEELPLDQVKKASKVSKYRALPNQWSVSPLTKGLKSVLKGISDAKAFYKTKEGDGKVRVYFSTLSEFPKDMRVIILSATPDYFVHKGFEVIKIENIICDKTVEVVWDKSTTGSATATSTLIRKGEKNENGDIPSRLKKDVLTICRKADVSRLKDLGYDVIEDVYFQYGCGTNSYSGKSLQIFGQQRIPLFILAMKAVTLGYEIPKEELDFSNKNNIVTADIDENGFKYQYHNTHKNEIVRKMSIALTRADLVQMIGRARLINSKNITVTYFGGLDHGGHVDAVKL